jgi:hypothetical protein
VVGEGPWGLAFADYGRMGLDKGDQAWRHGRGHSTHTGVEGGTCVIGDRVPHPVIQSRNSQGFLLARLGADAHSHACSLAGRAWKRGKKE